MEYEDAIPQQPISRAAVVAEARAWLSTPWEHQRSAKGVGCDCGGLVRGVARELGIRDVPDFAYGRIPDGVALRQFCDAYMVPISTDQMQPGDVLLMRFERNPQHLAIVSDYPIAQGELAIIHGYAIARKVVEHRLDDVWRSRIVQVYRLPGVR